MLELSGHEPGKLKEFLRKYGWQADWLSSLTWIGIGLLVFLHLFCFAAVAFSRVYYGENFNPVVFGQFVDAKKSGIWNPLEPGLAPPPAATAPQPTILSPQANAKGAAPVPVESTNDWMALTEEERQLVRTRKVQIAQNAMRTAERDWLEGRRDKALSELLAELEDLPDYPPLVRMLAEFYQENKDLSKARFFWEKVKLLTDAESMDRGAAIEHLAQIEQLENAPGSSLGSHRPVGAGKLKVVRVEEQRRPLEDMYDLNLSLEITLAANLTEPQVEPQHTKVEILFFDQYKTGGGAMLPVRTQVITLRPDKAWSSRDTKSVLARYSVQLGYWRKQLKTYGKSYDFCGYVVRVYYRGEFQDAAWSKDLLLPWRTPVS